MEHSVADDVVEVEDVPLQGPHEHGAWSEEEAECLRRFNNSRPPEFKPSRVDRYFSKRPALWGFRAAQIAFSAGGLASSIASDVVLGKAQSNASVRGRQLRERLTELGAAWVKLGQALSTRQDLLPAEYIDELSLLQDDLDGFSSTVAFDLIEQELGMPLEQLYASISPQPYASASIGQVHKATLHDGSTVAVKVQRPSIRDGVFLDFFLLKKAAQTIDSFNLITQSLEELITFFGQNVALELDYVNECQNAERFSRLYEGRVPGVRVPKVFWNRVSSKVLTQEWIFGKKLTDVEGLRQEGLDPVQFINIGVESSITQLLFSGYLHGDTHPSNIFAETNTTAPTLVYIDFGVVSTMPRAARYALTGHVIHLVNRDFAAMCRDYVKMDFIDPNEAAKLDFTPIESALANFFEGSVLNAGVSEVNIATIVRGLGDVFFQFGPFRLPAFYQLAIRLLVYYEGLALTLDQDFKLFQQAYPLLARRLLSGSNSVTELQELLEELLFQNRRLRWDRAIDLLKQANKSMSSSMKSSFSLPKRVLFEGTLFEKEAIRVLEAFTLAPSSTAASLLRSDAAARLLPRGIRSSAIALHRRFLTASEEDEMRELRAQAMSCWNELQEAGVLDQLALEELIQDSNVREFTGRVASSVLQRMAARSLRVAARSFG